MTGFLTTTPSLLLNHYQSRFAALSVKKLRQELEQTGGPVTIQRNNWNTIEVAEVIKANRNYFIVEDTEGTKHRNLQRGDWEIKT
jgi:hypothetical protein